MKIIDETNNAIYYFIDSIGTVIIKKDYYYRELTSMPITIASEDDISITYKMLDGNTCTVSKDNPMSQKEVIVRYWLLKTYSKKIY